MKKIVAMKTTLFLLTLLLAGTMFAQENKTESVNTSFIVFSDPHFYDPSLGIEGKAFEAYLDEDRKLLRESPELLLEALKIIGDSDVEFVVIPGDLTKDGTAASHKYFASRMEQLVTSGVKVFVIPGNHDISNGESNSFQGDSIVLVDNITPQEFEKIYTNLGYSLALYRDEHSLSYVAEPSPGLWLLGLDACLYRGNQPHHHPHTDGQFKDETLIWIDEISNLAKKEDKQIICFMHHGVLEHYKGQEKFYGEYIVNDYKKISRRLAENGIKVVFTGHYHAQDITMKRWDEETFIFDVETGSLVTYPCPVREVKIMDESMHITSHFINKMSSYEGDFTEYSRQFVYDGIAGIGERTMIEMGLRPIDAAKLSGQVGEAFVTHYVGDEPVGDHKLDLKGVKPLGKIIISFRKKLIKGLYEDLPPQDNDLVIDLNTGEVK
jgi:3',5'-cyclic AMP phosphodiesterase CpdA